MPDEQKDERNVRFNVAIADYRPGQIVKYADMPRGPQFWVDNDSILETTRICEFVEEEIPPETESILEPDKSEYMKNEEEDLTDENGGDTLPETESEDVINKMEDFIASFDSDDPKEQKTNPDAESSSGKDSLNFDFDNGSILETTKDSLNFDYDNLDPIDNVESKKNIADEFIGLSSPICPGKNKNGSPCKSNKLKPNGYCHFHQMQAPTGLTGEMPKSMKDVQGL